MLTRHLACVAVLCATFAALSASPAIPAQPEEAVAAELRDALLAQDHALFAALFDDRDAAKLRTLVTDDFEFYHDKWGQTADSADKFLEGIRGMFKRQDEGTDFRGRRELDLATVRIFPMKNYGAVMIGSHRFWNRDSGRRTETGQFVNLWKLENGTWKLARVISFDHRPWTD